MIKHLSSKHKALSSNPNIPEQKHKQKDVTVASCCFSDVDTDYEYIQCEQILILTDVCRHKHT
jgi:hypothetical protein